MSDHYHDDAPCPILYLMFDGVHINDVIDTLGLPSQDTVCNQGKYIALLRQDILNHPELLDYKIPLNEVDAFLQNVITDPSQATLADLRTIVFLDEWKAEVLE